MINKKITLYIFVLSYIFLLVQCKQKDIFEDLKIITIGEVINDNAGKPNRECVPLIPIIIMDTTIDNRLYIEDTLKDLSYIGKAFTIIKYMDIRENSILISSAAPTSSVIEYHFPLYNVKSINYLLKHHYKLHYNNLTEENKKRIIDFTLYFERGSYSSISKEWKVLKYQCENINNDTVIDSLYFNYSLTGKEELKNAKEKYKYSVIGHSFHKEDINSFVFSDTYPLKKIEIEERYTYMPNRTRFSQKFLNASKQIAPNTFFIIRDEEIYTLQRKLIFKYEFIDDNGFVQLTKTLLNIEDAYMLASCACG